MLWGVYVCWKFAFSPTCQLNAFSFMSELIFGPRKVKGSIKQKCAGCRAVCSGELQAQHGNSFLCYSVVLSWKESLIEDSQSLMNKALSNFQLWPCNQRSSAWKGLSVPIFHFDVHLCLCFALLIGLTLFIFISSAFHFCLPICVRKQKQNPRNPPNRLYHLIVY